MSFVGTTQFYLEVAKGNVPGHTVSSFVGSKPLVTSTGFETIWDIVGSFTFPTGGETWEISSNDADDTLLGTGARKVFITGLDTSYNPQTELVDMNGTTAVTTTRTDWLRINSILVTSSGSSAWNEGTVTLQVSGGGAVRATMRPTLASSFNGFFTVPLGKTMFVTQAIAFSAKGADLTIRNRIRIFGTDTFVGGGDAPTYQSETRIPFFAIPGFPEKTDIHATASTSNASIEGAFQTEFILVDNDQVAAAASSMILT